MCAIAIFSWEVGCATDHLTANLCLHVYCRDVAIQMVLCHVLITTVLTLILLNVRMRIHVMIQLGLREVPKRNTSQLISKVKLERILTSCRTVHTSMSVLDGDASGEV